MPTTSTAGPARVLASPLRTGLLRGVHLPGDALPLFLRLGALDGMKSCPCCLAAEFDRPPATVWAALRKVGREELLQPAAVVDLRVSEEPVNVTLVREGGAVVTAREVVEVHLRRIVWGPRSGDVGHLPSRPDAGTVGDEGRARVARCLAEPEHRRAVAEIDADALRWLAAPVLPEPRQDAGCWELATRYGPFEIPVRPEPGRFSEGTWRGVLLAPPFDVAPLRLARFERLSREVPSVADAEGAGVVVAPLAAERAHEWCLEARRSAEAGVPEDAEELARFAVRTGLADASEKGLAREWFATATRNRAAQRRALRVRGLRANRAHRSGGNSVRFKRAPEVVVDELAEAEAASILARALSDARARFAGQPAALAALDALANPGEGAVRRAAAAWGVSVERVRSARGKRPDAPGPVCRFLRSRVEELTAPE